MLKKLLPLVLCLLIACFTTDYGLSSEDENTQPFSELIATTSESHLILFGIVKSTFSEEMLSALQSGLPIHFSFHVELYRDNEDTPWTALDFLHSMTYNTLKESYEILIEEANAKLVRATSIERAKAIMDEINGLKVVDLDRLLPGRYKLRIRADLFEKTLPMGIDRVLPFISTWDKETKWQTLEFSY